VSRKPKRSLAATPKEANTNLVRHVEMCQSCQYNADACEVGKKLHGIWHEIASLAMRQIWR
jgi:hypothetical protein